MLRRLFRRKSKASTTGGSNDATITASPALSPHERLKKAKLDVAVLKGDIELLKGLPYTYEVKRALELGELYDNLALAELELESALRALTEERANT